MVTPFISRERVKLGVSNLACILSTRGTNKKRRIRSKGVGKGSHNLLYEYWDPQHICGAAEARKSKFGTPMQNDNALDDQ